tara:strand:- start:908 stop:1561 length:654 start_codon:yes stop_codon:yes gene_type:complete
LEFNSTATYANRYDLDEIDVFLEGNSSNPMFFNISGLPDNLSFGKHYFHISLLNSMNQEYELRPNSKILFEFKSINNVVAPSEVVNIDQRSGVAISYINIIKNPLRTFKEIQDGQGTLTIVGSLQDKENTINNIPQQFIGAMNYRCTFPINIAKNLVNADSPFVLQNQHKTSTIRGQFSFIKASIAAPKFSNLGITYSPTGNPSDNRPGDGGGGGTV